MSVEKDIGQLLMIGLAGTSLRRPEREFIKRVQPAGVIYFRRNIRSPKQVAALSRSIQKLFPKEKPPLIAVDQEGGRVARLTPPFTVFPGNDYLGRYYKRTKKIDLARAQVRAQASELRAVGINYNFTPVADLNTNPRNPIIGSRSFGKVPKSVSRLAGATILAYRKERIVTCAKHFPGHGDTASDSHKVLPVVRAGKVQLQKRELVPFRAAIRAGVPTIMTAHVVYPSLDKSRPATLSSSILVDLLRGRLGFKGVCVSDDLEMAGIARHQDVPDASVRALLSGVDLLLVCKSLPLAHRVFRRISAAVQKGEIPSKRMSEALRRIRILKKSYLSGRRQPVRTHARPQGWPVHRRLAEKIAKSGK